MRRQQLADISQKTNASKPDRRLKFVEIRQYIKDRKKEYNVNFTVNNEPQKADSENNSKQFIIIIVLLLH